MFSLDNSLTELLDTIRERRLVDAELDEIWRDFETLSIDFNRVAQLEGDEAGRQKIVIHESLEALEQEIRAIMAKD